MDKRKFQETQEPRAEGSAFHFKKIRSKVRDAIQEDIFEIREEISKGFELRSGCDKQSEFERKTSDSEEESEDEESETDDFSDTINSKNLQLNVQKAGNYVVSTQFMLKGIPFLETPGLRKKPENVSPIGVFDFLLTEEFYDFVIKQSNKYAKSETFLINNRKFSRYLSLDISRSEFRRFIGVILHMGTIKTENMEDYWKKSILFNLDCFTRHMSQARFLYILRCLTFSQGTELDDHHYVKYQKVDWIIHYFNKKMKEVFCPHQRLTVIEPTVSERNKLNSRNEKIYLLSERTGPILQMRVHTEKTARKEKREKSLIVLDLMEGLLDKGYSLFLDSQFMSWELVSTLISRNTHCTGYLPESRKIDVFNRITLKRGEVAWVVNDNIVVGKWQGKQEVLFASTEFSIDSDIGRKTKILIPMAISMLQRAQEGVENTNNMLDFYASEKKNLAWSKKLAIQIIDILLMNSWYLYDTISKKTTTFSNFRLSVIESLLLTEDSSSEDEDEDEDEDEETDKSDDEMSEGNNMVETQWEVEDDPLAIDPLDQCDPLQEKVESSHLPCTGKSRKRCRQCYKEGKRRETHVYCSLCKGEPGLCIDPCFKLYHEVS